MKVKIKNKLSKKKIILIISISIFAIIFAVFVFLLIKVNSSASKAFRGNTTDIIANYDYLQKDANNNTSFLIFGNSKDDAGHSGALLADSIIVFIVNQKSDMAKVLSIPRDLWVQYGMNCSNGTEGKINAYYQCALKNNNNDEQLASESFASFVGNILNIDIQYNAQVSYNFVKQAVDAVGGVDIVIESDDPRGILDRSFDGKCPDGPRTCYFVKYENGPVHLDGTHALYLAMVRNASGGYGLPASNFDREINQQKILKALQEKALSAGVLTNILKLTSLVEALGDNITTNIKTSEVRNAADILAVLKSDSIMTIDLHSNENPLVTTGSISSQSVVLPSAGLFNYTDIQTAVSSL